MEGLVRKRNSDKGARIEIGEDMEDKIVWEMEQERREMCVVVVVVGG